MKLEYLCPYLPYGIKAQGISKRFSTGDKLDVIEGLVTLNMDEGNSINIIDSKTGEGYIFSLNNDIVKLILKPFSKITEEDYQEMYDLCGDIDDNLDYIFEFNGDVRKSNFSYKLVNCLIKNHYDVFGLFNEDLAVFK